ncbi:hypothetical protein OHU11_42280 (plasmid) [Streptomyces sp. NBC_00257]|uniref:hypothetical protein n=1 Tax=unclassified Streptomyces TaxID=2593676 RepID=UPI00225A16D1|nr:MULTISPECIES: hypothetical protein [unclassified Streptomyces]MCX5434807.1 hypothetical protein [Streptomyces sp. NBC_00062]
MAVNRIDYRMWARLAQRDDLPGAAFPAVVDGLLAKDGFAEGWQADVFMEALPSLLVRVREQELRDRLIQAAGSRTSELIRQGLVGGRDVPAVLRYHQVNSELLAALAQDDAHRDVVTEVIGSAAPDMLLGVLLSAERPTHGNPGRLAEIPPWLFDAVLQRHLVLVTAELKAFASGSEPEPDLFGRSASWPSHGTLAMVLERCPEKWPELLNDATHGLTVQHALLDCVDTEKLTDEVLAACVPALVLAEWAELTKPAKSQRERLRHIARSVVRHPRLRELASAQLEEVAASCVKRGRLLHATNLRRLAEYEVTSLARDLAWTSGSAKDLVKMWELVAALPEPSAVERPSQYDGGEPPSPKLVLSSDRRVGALAALAGNPNLDRRLVLDVLDQLNPVEVRWLTTYDDEVPAWLKEAAARHKASPTQPEVPRVLTDEELDSCADPEAVMQTWLDAVKGDHGVYNHQIEYAILRSRHRTDTLVRQLTAPTVLSYYEHPVVADALMRLCGTDPDRWHAVAEALASKRDFDETFGDFLDRMSVPPA